MVSLETTFSKLKQRQNEMLQFLNASGEKPYSTDSIHNKAQIFAIDASKADNLATKQRSV